VIAVSLHQLLKAFTSESLGKSPTVLRINRRDMERLARECYLPPDATMLTFMGCKCMPTNSPVPYFALRA
jgi:hypothetical protein